MSLSPLPPGHVGAVVTYLETTERPAAEPAPDGGGLRLERWEQVDLARYRALFARVGGPWLWYSRLAMDDSALERALGELWVVRDADGGDCGFVELEYAAPARCLIRFLGLVPERAGRGHGRWLLAETLRRAWRDDVDQVALHTCSLDHPAALPAYLKAGFRAVRRAFESFPDPRLSGLLPRDAAPHIPIVDQANTSAAGARVSSR